MIHREPPGVSGGFIPMHESSASCLQVRLLLRTRTATFAAEGLTDLTGGVANCLVLLLCSMCHSTYQLADVVTATAEGGHNTGGMAVGEAVEVFDDNQICNCAAD